MGRLNKETHTTRLVAFVIALLLVLSACSGSSEDTYATTTALQNDDAVSSLEDVRGAVIRISSQGSFDYPGEETQYNEGFTGSGFFISSDGLAVTNNHVVTGAAFLLIHVEGEDEPRNAKILGVSECSDLAVIDVEGEGFNYLAWHEGDSPAGMKVYSAGFPLGDEEYTLLDGIVSKEKADGESSWASVDSVIEHTSDILGGNSGGPLVGEDGRVVGVNYAGNDEGQAFAIGYSEVSKILEVLQGGENVNSIGINGTAISDEYGSGIWVHSVESGSPADLVGVRGGDIVTELSGLIPGVDGTMSDYCDVLRSHDSGDAIQIEVWREEVLSYMEGTLNTEKTLAEIGGTSVDPTGTGNATGETVVNIYAGDCIDDSEVDVYLNGGMPTLTSCDLPHDNEVFSVYYFADGSYPGDDAVLDELSTWCLAEFEWYVESSYETSILDIWALAPTQSTWESGLLVGECLLYRLDFEKMTGSAFMSGQ